MRNLNRILILASLVAAGISAKAVTEITYWLWDNNQLPAYQACAAEFEKQNPDIKVKITQTGWSSGHCLSGLRISLKSRRNSSSAPLFASWTMAFSSGSLLGTLESLSYGQT